MQVNPSTLLFSARREAEQLNPSFPYPFRSQLPKPAPKKEPGKVKLAVKKIRDKIADKVDKKIEEWAIKATRDQTTQR